MNKNIDTKHNTKSIGNTSSDALVKKHSIRFRNWLITDFNKDERLNYHPKSIYDVRCDDTTKDGKYHFHAFLMFKNAVSFNTIKSLFPNAHIEKAQNIYDSIGYIKNNVNGRKKVYYEEGTEPRKLEKVKDLKQCDNPDELDWKQYNTWLKIKNKPQKLKVDEWHKDVKVYYISGPSGIGKSKKAFDLMKELNIKEFEEIKYENGFYNGVVEGTGCCVYDDFRDSVMKPNEFINLIDYNIHNLNVKGGNVKNFYSTIIITSIIELNDLYKNCREEQREQWIRRVEEINLYPIDEDAY